MQKEFEIIKIKELVKIISGKYDMYKAIGVFLPENLILYIINKNTYFVPIGMNQENYKIDISDLIFTTYSLDLIILNLEEYILESL